MQQGKVNAGALRALEHLGVILDAGERGYAVAAANVNNRALKLVLKTYARQRADWKQQLHELAGKGIARSRPLVRLMAMVHRGRINIFAALTIGEQSRERVVLKEILVGERAALQAYERALRKDLPTELSRLVETQYQQVQQEVEQVRLMLGVEGRQLVVRLFDSPRDAEHAIEQLRQAGFDSAAIGKVSVEQDASAYKEGSRGRLLETIISGAAGGAMWGSISGALAGFGLLHLPGLGLEGAPLAIQELAWAETALGAIFAGAFVGALLGTFIGWGIQGGDAYLYGDSQQRGQVLARLDVPPDRAAEAAQIMARINREARAQHRHALA